ncbi:MAG TPA: hypothetical protein VJN90_04860 [Candidatus Acidoferrales bacterium]|nr:hypothetical protein [Candidatus Acidoferrales bacterium]
MTRPRVITLRCAVALCAVILTTLVVWPQVLASDKGKFRDTVNGRQVGSEQFEISSSGGDWVAQGTSDVKPAQGPQTHITSLLRLRADGAPMHYEWATVAGSKKAAASIDFDNGTATVHLEINGGKPFTQQFFFKTPVVAILDDNLYHQYAILADLYDWSKKGQQTFPVFIPQEMTPGTITVEALDPASQDGKNLQRLKVRSQDLEITLYLDGKRVVRVEVPSANAEIVRD